MVGTQIPRVELTETQWRRYEPRLRAIAARRRELRPAEGRGAAAILEDCRRTFRAFLPFWTFRNRDTGAITTFAQLWRGQDRLVDVWEDKARAGYPNGPWVFELKAGKLGFTELECAYDAWTALFRCPNARVHIFSRDLPSAKEFLRVVRFGLRRLPAFFGVRIPENEADSDTTTSLRLYMGPDDDRVVKSYATGEHVSIDQVAHHVHVDEWARMKIHKKLFWEEVQTTVAPGGTLHIVTRGAGDDADVRELWDAAARGGHELVAFFAPFDERDDRDEAWYEREANRNTAAGIAHFAPRLPEDALMGDADNDYIPLGVWDACLDPGLPPFLPDPMGEPSVLALDAAVSGDSFAAVAATRHPDHPGGCGRSRVDPAIRAVKVWRPEDFPDGRINFTVVEGWIRAVAQGGCPGDPAARIDAHPLYAPSPQTPREWCRRDDCQSCAAGVAMPAFNVVQVVYDHFQLEDMMQRFRNEGVCQSLRDFDQGRARLVADSGLYTLALTKHLAHGGDPVLREHVGNARAKLQAAEDSKMRIVKKDSKRRVDAVVAASMAVDEVLRLYL